MKVWERGAGPTLACGTGACALTVAAVLAGKAERTCKVSLPALTLTPTLTLSPTLTLTPPLNPNPNPNQVSLPGGDLQIEWRESNNRIYMTGPAEPTFKGEYTVQ